MDAIVDSTGDDEEEGEEEERRGEPLTTRDTVGEEDEADTASNGSERDSEEILLGLLNEDVVYGVAGVGGVSLPDGETNGVPLGDGGCAAGEGGVPAAEGGVDLGIGASCPHIGQCTAVIEGDSVEANIKDEP